MLPTEPCKTEILLLFTFVQVDNSHVSYDYMPTQGVGI